MTVGINSVPPATPNSPRSNSKTEEIKYAQRSKGPAGQRVVRKEDLPVASQPNNGGRARKKPATGTSANNTASPEDPPSSESLRRQPEDTSGGIRPKAVQPPKPRAQSKSKSTTPTTEEADRLSKPVTVSDTTPPESQTQGVARRRANKTAGELVQAPPKSRVVVRRKVPVKAKVPAREAAQAEQTQSRAAEGTTRSAQVERGASGRPNEVPGSLTVPKPPTTSRGTGPRRAARSKAGTSAGPTPKSEALPRGRGAKRSATTLKQPPAVLSAKAKQAALVNRSSPPRREADESPLYATPAEHSPTAELAGDGRLEETSPADESIEKSPYYATAVEDTPPPGRDRSEGLPLPQMSADWRFGQSKSGEPWSGESSEPAAHPRLRKAPTSRPNSYILEEDHTPVPDAEVPSTDVRLTPPELRLQPAVPAQGPTDALRVNNGRVTKYRPICPVREDVRVSHGYGYGRSLADKYDRGRRNIWTATKWKHDKFNIKYLKDHFPRYGPENAMHWDTVSAEAHNRPQLMRVPVAAGSCPPPQTLEMLRIEAEDVFHIGTEALTKKAKEDQELKQTMVITQWYRGYPGEMRLVPTAQLPDIKIARAKCKTNWCLRRFMVLLNAPFTRNDALDLPGGEPLYDVESDEATGSELDWYMNIHLGPRHYMIEAPEHPDTEPKAQNHLNLYAFDAMIDLTTPFGPELPMIEAQVRWDCGSKEWRDILGSTIYSGRCTRFQLASYLMVVHATHLLVIAIDRLFPEDTLIEVNKLFRYINNLPAGVVVAIATREEPWAIYKYSTNMGWTFPVIHASRCAMRSFLQAEIESEYSMSISMFTALGRRVYFQPGYIPNFAQGLIAPFTHVVWRNCPCHGTPGLPCYNSIDRYALDDEVGPIRPCGSLNMHYSDRNTLDNLRKLNSRERPDELLAVFRGPKQQVNLPERYRPQFLIHLGVEVDPLVLSQLQVVRRMVDLCCLQLVISLTPLEFEQPEKIRKEVESWDLDCYIIFEDHYPLLEWLGLEYIGKDGCAIYDCDLNLYFSDFDLHPLWGIGRALHIWEGHFLGAKSPEWPILCQSYCVVASMWARHYNCWSPYVLRLEYEHGSREDKFIMYKQRSPFVSLGQLNDKEMFEIINRIRLDTHQMYESKEKPLLLRKLCFEIIEKEINRTLSSLDYGSEKSKIKQLAARFSVFGGRHSQELKCRNWTDFDQLNFEAVKDYEFVVNRGISSPRVNTTLAERKAARRRLVRSAKDRAKFLWPTVVDLNRNASGVSSVEPTPNLDVTAVPLINSEDFNDDSSDDENVPHIPEVWEENTLPVRIQFARKSRAKRAAKLAENYRWAFERRLMTERLSVVEKVRNLVPNDFRHLLSDDKIALCQWICPKALRPHSKHDKGIVTFVRVDAPKMARDGDKDFVFVCDDPEETIPAAPTRDQLEFERELVEHALKFVRVWPIDYPDNTGASNAEYGLRARDEHDNRIHHPTAREYVGRAGGLVVYLGDVLTRQDHTLRLVLPPEEPITELTKPHRDNGPIIFTLDGPTRKVYLYSAADDAFLVEIQRDLELSVYAQHPFEAIRIEIISVTMAHLEDDKMSVTDNPDESTILAHFMPEQGRTSLRAHEGTFLQYGHVRSFNLELMPRTSLAKLGAQFATHPQMSLPPEDPFMRNNIFGQGVNEAAWRPKEKPRDILFFHPPGFELYPPSPAPRPKAKPRPQPPTRLQFSPPPSPKAIPRPQPPTSLQFNPPPEIYPHTEYNREAILRPPPDLSQWAPTAAQMAHLEFSQARSPRNRNLPVDPYLVAGIPSSEGPVDSDELPNTHGAISSGGDDAYYDRPLAHYGMLARDVPSPPGGGRKRHNPTDNNLDEPTRKKQKAEQPFPTLMAYDGSTTEVHPHSPVEESDSSDAQSGLEGGEEISVLDSSDSYDSPNGADGNFLPIIESLPQESATAADPIRFVPTAGFRGNFTRPSIHDNEPGMGRHVVSPSSSPYHPQENIAVAKRAVPPPRSQMERPTHKSPQVQSRRRRQVPVSSQPPVSPPLPEVTNRLTTQPGLVSEVEVEPTSRAVSQAKAKSGPTAKNSEVVRGKSRTNKKVTNRQQVTQSSKRPVVKETSSEEIVPEMQNASIPEGWRAFVKEETPPVLDSIGTAPNLLRPRPPPGRVGRRPTYEGERSSSLNSLNEAENVNVFPEPYHADPSLRTDDEALSDTLGIYNSGGNRTAKSRTASQAEVEPRGANRSRGKMPSPGVLNSPEQNGQRKKTTTVGRRRRAQAEIPSQPDVYPVPTVPSPAKKSPATRVDQVASPPRRVLRSHTRTQSPKDSSDVPAGNLVRVKAARARSKATQPAASGEVPQESVGSGTQNPSQNRRLPPAGTQEAAKALFPNDSIPEVPQESVGSGTQNPSQNRRLPPAGTQEAAKALFPEDSIPEEKKKKASRRRASQSKERKAAEEGSTETAAAKKAGEKLSTPDRKAHAKKVSRSQSKQRTATERMDMGSRVTRTENAGADPFVSARGTSKPKSAARKPKLVVKRSKSRVENDSQPVTETTAVSERAEPPVKRNRKDGELKLHQRGRLPKEQRVVTVETLKKKNGPTRQGSSSAPFTPPEESVHEALTRTHTEEVLPARTAPVSDPQSAPRRLSSPADGPSSANLLSESTDMSLKARDRARQGSVSASPKPRHEESEDDSTSAATTEPSNVAMDRTLLKSEQRDQPRSSAEDAVGAQSAGPGETKRRKRAFPSRTQNPRASKTRGRAKALNAELVAELSLEHFENFGHAASSDGAELFTALPLPSVSVSDEDVESVIKALEAKLEPEQNVKVRTKSKTKPLKSFSAATSAAAALSGTPVERSPTSSSDRATDPVEGPDVHKAVVALLVEKASDKGQKNRPKRGRSMKEVGELEIEPKNKRTRQHTRLTHRPESSPNDAKKETLVARSEVATVSETATRSTTVGKALVVDSESPSCHLPDITDVNPVIERTAEEEEAKRLIEAANSRAAAKVVKRAKEALEVVDKEVAAELKGEPSSSSGGAEFNTIVVESKETKKRGRKGKMEGGAARSAGRPQRARKPTLAVMESTLEALDQAEKRAAKKADQEARKAEQEAKKAEQEARRAEAEAKRAAKKLEVELKKKLRAEAKAASAVKRQTRNKSSVARNETNSSEPASSTTGLSVSPTDKALSSTSPETVTSDFACMMPHTVPPVQYASPSRRKPSAADKPRASPQSTAESTMTGGKLITRKPKGKKLSPTSNPIADLRYSP